MPGPWHDRIWAGWEKMVVGGSDTERSWQKRQSLGYVRNKSLNLSEPQFVCSFLKVFIKTESCNVTWSSLTCHLPVLVSWVLGLQACTMAPGFKSPHQGNGAQMIASEVSERIEGTLKVKVDAHSRCSWKVLLFLPPFLPGILLPWRTVLSSH